jgi:hypothetical protein
VSESNHRKFYTGSAYIVLNVRYSSILTLLACRSSNKEVDDLNTWRSRWLIFQLRSKISKDHCHHHNGVLYFDINYFDMYLILSILHVCGNRPFSPKVVLRIMTFIIGWEMTQKRFVLFLVLLSYLLLQSYINVNSPHEKFLKLYIPTLQWLDSMICIFHRELCICRWIQAWHQTRHLSWMQP